MQEERDREAALSFMAEAKASTTQWKEATSFWKRACMRPHSANTEMPALDNS